jgi:AcrR family transcriptional regulator
MALSGEARPDLSASARGRRVLRARHELATTAVRLFDTRGFAETTVEEIAEAADYSASTFFRHFGTKEDAVFYDIGERMTEYQALLELPAKQNAWPQVRAALLANAAYWEDSDPDFGLARTRLFHREPLIYRRFLAYCDEVERTLTQVLARSRGTRPEQDVWCEVVAAGAVGAWRAGFAKWLDSGGRLEKHIAAGLDVLEPITSAPRRSGAGRRA